ncbi:ABC transporter permease [uncultured Enterovirga sp.]|uniref:ABC transporter permease n=1 Tax=uncultured Enterovirga sp. TaxID=2026352 RepID=UPI0035CA3FBE
MSRSRWRGLGREAVELALPTLVVPPLTFVSDGTEPAQGDPPRHVFRLVLLVVAALVAAPLLSLAVTAVQGTGIWEEGLGWTSLRRALFDSVALLAGTGIVVLCLGVGSAWLVSVYDFPGRGWVEPALVLPLAIPTYIVAFCYLDILHPIGPVQTGLRGLLGLARPADLWWFPDVRSTGMCALLLGFVLYPYVYLPTRALFLAQGAELLDAASSLGARPGQVFRRVALPLARPGIVAGTSLALLEALNDVGASEYLGVRTLTVTIYETWVNRSNFAGAAQIALATLLVVAALIGAERWARRRRDMAGPEGGGRADRRRLSGWRAAAALALALVPVLVGFAAPSLHLVLSAASRIGYAGLSPTLVDETIATVLLALAATSAIVLLALVLACGGRLFPSRGSAWLRWTAALGYGVPGIILAVGCLAPLVAIDGIMAGIVGAVSGFEIGLVLVGSSAALVYVYAVRFLAVALGAIEAGLAKVPLSLDEASLGLGARRTGTVGRIHLPLAATSIASGALLVFVECAKELPATLLLRPLNVETLATHLHGEAIRGTYEDGTIAALLIVAIGLVPLALLMRIGRPPAPGSVKERQGSEEVGAPG